MILLLCFGAIILLLYLSKKMVTKEIERDKERDKKREEAKLKASQQESESEDSQVVAENTENSVQTETNEQNRAIIEEKPEAPEDSSGKEEKV